MRERVVEKLVLLIDDDNLPMKFYVKALEHEGFRVNHCFNPDSALDFAMEETSRIDAIILDIMLPPGQIYRSENTNDGLKTSVLLLKDLRHYCPDAAVVVLTNVSKPSTLNEFKGQNSVEVVQKISCPPFGLVEIVRKMLKMCDEES